MDVRGTGASTGTWRRSRSREETRDYAEVAEWIARQPWSDGTIAGWGISYGANTADFLAAEAGRRVKAIVPLFPDYDAYNDLLFPGGVFHLAFGKLWSEAVKQQDLNVPRPGPDGRSRGVRPVEGEGGEELLRQLVAARESVPDMYQGLRLITYKDDDPPGFGGGYTERSAHAQVRALEASGAAMLTWGSWMDAGTANGVLHRFMTLRNPQRAAIGAWSHAARFAASPYLPPDSPLEPTLEQQQMEQLCFLDQFARGRPSGMDDRLLAYYTMGEERWKTTGVWPPPGSREETWYLGPDGTLTRQAPAAASGADRYTVDFDATTGTTNRWYTQRGGGDVIYPDRAEADRRLLTYTSGPLDRDLEITGTPVVTLRVRSTAADGAFFVYLEDVAPEGRVTYLTEGQLRAVHRKVSTEPPPYRTFAPYRTYLRKDALPLVPGEVAELRFGLLPTSVRIHRGHRIRVAIAGADRDSFARVPEAEVPVITVERNRDSPSSIVLPVAGGEPR
jgi:putative CocE/NonD family hydrolase